MIPYSSTNSTNSGDQFRGTLCSESDLLPSALSPASSPAVGIVRVTSADTWARRKVPAKALHPFGEIVTRSPCLRFPTPVLRESHRRCLHSNYGDPFLSVPCYDQDPTSVITRMMLPPDDKFWSRPCGTATLVDSVAGDLERAA